MSKIATDIVLLPPKEIMRICVRLNHAKNAESFQTFNLNNNLPHISLAMGVLNTADLNKAKENLEKISKNFSPLKLELTKIHSHATPDNKKSYDFRVSITDELQKLHNQIVSDYAAILSHDIVSLDMFYSDKNEPLDEISCYWVKNYPNKAFENFSAHISLKCRNVSYRLDMPIKFKADEIALCHIGNFCTCRKILSSVKLIY